MCNDMLQLVQLSVPKCGFYKLPEIFESNHLILGAFYALRYADL